jgi:hypothetical protein
MTTSVVLYEKDGEIIQVNDKFIYEDSIYKVFEHGISLQAEKYYSTDKPLKLKKKDYTNRKKGAKEYLVRYLTLEFAPEKWLINNNYTKYDEK